jgi:Leucine Rich repeats (2 copies)/Domain of unknown function DUF11
LLIVLLPACNRQPLPSLETPKDVSESTSFVVPADGGDFSAQATTPSGRLVLTLGLNPEVNGTGTFGKSVLYWYGPSGSRLNGTVSLKLVSRNNANQFVTANNLTVNAGTINTFSTAVLPKTGAPFCLEATFALTSSTGQRFNTAQPLTLCTRRKGEAAVSNLRIESAAPLSGPVPFVFGEPQLLNFNIINTGTSPVLTAVRVNISLPEGLSYVGTDPNIFNCIATGQLIECTTAAANLPVGARSLPIRVVANERCAVSDCEALALQGQLRYDAQVAAFISDMANSTFSVDVSADAALTVSANDLSGITNEAMNFTVNVANRGQTARSNVVVTLNNSALEFVSETSSQFNCSQNTSGGFGPITCQAAAALPVGSFSIPLVVKSAQVIAPGNANGFDKIRLRVAVGVQWNVAAVNLTTQACVTFPDSNLEAAVREALAMPTGRICTDDMQNLFALDGFFQDISDLTGLEYATNLAELDLGDNAITDISPLAGLTNLSDLDLSLNTGITDISPLAGLANLLSLNLYSTNPGDISVLSDL